jgi:hypothetical protein
VIATFFIAVVLSGISLWLLERRNILASIVFALAGLTTGIVFLVQIVSGGGS